MALPVASAARTLAGLAVVARGGLREARAP